MIIPSQFKKLTKKDISKISDDNLKNILTAFSSKTNENDIAYLFKSSFSLRQRVYIRSKVLHDFSSRSENENITIDLLAKTIKSTIDEEDLESIGNVNNIKRLLKKYLSNYQKRTQVISSKLSILGEVVTMLCLAKEYHNITFYDFLDEIYFLKWQPDRNLSHFNVHTKIKLSTEKISYMSAIYDDTKFNEKYYAWLYSSYYGSKKISQKCGSGKNYEYHHEESDFVDFIKNSKPSDKDRCFTWMENYNKSVKKQFFSEGNKLSTADIYLVKKGKVKDIKKILERKTFLDEDGNKLLNIKDYLKIITRLYRIKNLFPISLKQVENNNPPYSVLNYSSVFLRETKEDDDWFYQQMLFLQQLSKNKAKFVDYIDKLITLKDFKYNPQQATQKFYFNYTIKSKNKSENKVLNYFLEMVAGRGSILIKPLSTSSQSGEGQITYQVFNEMTNIAAYRNSFSKAYRDLIASRISILNSVSPNNNIGKEKLREVKEKLRKVGVFRKKEMSEIINTLNTDKMKYDFMNTYAEYLIDKEIPKNLTQEIKTKYKLLNRAGKLNQRNLVQFIGFLLDLEFLYFISSNQKLVGEFVKKKIILSMHSAASGRGYLVVSQSRFSQGKMYLSNLQSALTVKVGL